MTRKPMQKRKRSADIRVMTTPEERRELQKGADAAGLALSTFVHLRSPACPGGGAEGRNHQRKGCVTTKRTRTMDESNISTVSEAALDGRARRAAKRIGLEARRSRCHRDSLDNYNGFMLVDAYTNFAVAGFRCDMTAEDVIAFCAEDDAEAA
jgi:hypothetical protein